MTEDSDSMVGRMLGVKVAGEAAAVDMTGALGLGLGFGLHACHAADPNPTLS